MKIVGLLVTYAVVAVVVIVTYNTVAAPIVAETGEIWRGIADALEGK
jgi:hypothetical protein